ncbi:uridine kinase [Paenibacillus sp. JCM 10914]|uniref:3-oxoacyl-ACP synthase III n=1 Tax=Paenibacillus sp. JCM 10914 TaxID=1236974 RepID=UPI0003CC8E1C|nr:3-oxoacyl-ACP synthase III [Paenibacillus sp. JCM 10914]GAE04959.1 3-oxoacyl-[acyl-carrier-protein] synthase, KASIII [Paenibacillus sp. JCM 10914]
MISKPCITIGISGGSGSGKTTLSLVLEDQLKDCRIAVYHMDKYYKSVRPLAKAPFTGNVLEDFNHPDGVDLQRLSTDYDQALLSGDYDVVIIEGFLLFHFERLRETLDLKLYVDCPADERMVPRSEWFINKGYSRDEVTQEYLQLVRYRHDEYVEPTRWYADLIMNGSTGGDLGTQVVLDWIRVRLQERS